VVGVGIRVEEKDNRLEVNGKWLPWHVHVQARSFSELSGLKNWSQWFRLLKEVQSTSGLDCVEGLAEYTREERSKHRH